MSKMDYSALYSGGAVFLGGNVFEWPGGVVARYMYGVEASGGPCMQDGV